MTYNPAQAGEDVARPQQFQHRQSAGVGLLLVHQTPVTAHSILPVGYDKGLKHINRCGTPCRAAVSGLMAQQELQGQHAAPTSSWQNCSCRLARGPTTGKSA